MTYSLDTNILVRFFIVDKEYLKVEELLENQKNNIHISDLVLSEMIYVFEKYYQVSRKTICDFLDYLIQKENVNINRIWLGQCRDIYENRPELSFVDIGALIYAKLNKATPLLTLDQNLLKFDKKATRSL